MSGGFNYLTDLEKGTTHLGGQSLVFHCHFYNCQLQEAIEDGMGSAAPGVLTKAAVDTVAPQLRAIADGATGADLLQRAEQLFAELGFGALSLGALGPDGGEAISPHSHYAMGWLATRGPRETPACFFPAGFIAGAFAAAHSIDPAAVVVTESRCFAMGADDCAFTVAVSR